MSNIYCGIKNVPKGKKLGTLQQCLNNQQVRYYGIKKIKPADLNLKAELTKLKRKRTMLINNISKNKGKLIRLNRNLIGYKKDPKKLKDTQKEVDDVNKLLTKLLKEYKDVELQLKN